MADLGLQQSGLDRVIRAAYDLLGYMSFFTVGEDECRAWSIPRQTRAQEAAGAIHSDIQRGFIRAEVVPWDTLIARGSLAACRDHGELRLEGKDYVVARRRHDQFPSCHVMPSRPSWSAKRRCRSFAAAPRRCRASWCASSASADSTPNW